MGAGCGSELSSYGTFGDSTRNIRISPGDQIEFVGSKFFVSSDLHLDIVAFSGGTSKTGPTDVTFDVFYPTLSKERDGDETRLGI